MCAKVAKLASTNTRASVVMCAKVAKLASTNTRASAMRACQHA
jgi:hypothetical protein